MHSEGAATRASGAAAETGSGGLTGAAEVPKVKGVGELEEEHHGAGHDVLEHGDEEHHPAHRTEAADKGLDDGAEAREGLGQSEDAQEPQEPQNHHGDVAEDDLGGGHLDVAHGDDEEVEAVPLARLGVRKVPAQATRRRARGGGQPR